MFVCHSINRHLWCSTLSTIVSLSCSLWTLWLKWILVRFFGNHETLRVGLLHTVTDVVVLFGSFTFVLFIFVCKVAYFILDCAGMLRCLWHSDILLILRCYGFELLHWLFFQHYNLLLFFLQWFIWRILFLLFLCSKFGCCIGGVVDVWKQIGNKNLWFRLLLFLGLGIGIN